MEGAAETPGTPESEPAPSASAMPNERSGAAAMLVSAGILASRVFGLLRQILQAHYIGAGVAADAFTAAFKIPNVLQNMFGEGALSASFIPVYSRLLAEGKEEEAGHVAGAVFALLSLTVAVIVLVGVVAAPVLILLIAAGFDAEHKRLTIEYTRVLFPGAGIFVISAWCLGILNSHRKFLLSYSAPVLWNVAMIVALIWFGRERASPADLASKLAWASVVGAAMQFLVQVPSTVGLVKYLRLSVDTTSHHVRTVMRNFGPVFVSRGVVQISAYIDQWIATFLPTGIVATLFYAQTIYVLPVSLFGMAVSAAQLPEMSSALGHEHEVAAFLRAKVNSGLRHIAYFVIPSALAFVAFGDIITGLLLRHGRFSAQNALYAWGILAGSSVGLLASTMGRLYSSTYYALHDTKTPLRFALVRVFLTTVLGYVFAITLPPLIGLDVHWGAAGLTSSAGIAGWVEFLLLRSRLNRRIGETGLPRKLSAQLWACAIVATLAGWGTRYIVAGQNRFVGGIAVLVVFGLVYLGATIVAHVPEARVALARLTRRRPR
jgi:putative peptidoglycan lipid II flippase